MTAHSITAAASPETANAVTNAGVPVREEDAQIHELHSASLAATLLVILHCANCALAQSAPVSSDRPWHSPAERNIEADPRDIPDSRFTIDPAELRGREPNGLAKALEGMADRTEGNESTQKQDLSKAYAQLEQAAWKGSPKTQNQFSPQIESFLLLSRRIALLTDSLEKEI